MNKVLKEKAQNWVSHSIISKERNKEEKMVSKFQTKRKFILEYMKEGGILNM